MRRERRGKGGEGRGGEQSCDGYGDLMVGKLGHCAYKAGVIKMILSNEFIE